MTEDFCFCKSISVASRLHQRNSRRRRKTVIFFTFQFVCFPGKSQIGTKFPFVSEDPFVNVFRRVRIHEVLMKSHVNNQDYLVIVVVGVVVVIDSK